MGDSCNITSKFSAESRAAGLRRSQRFLLAITFVCYVFLARCIIRIFANSVKERIAISNAWDTTYKMLSTESLLIINWTSNTIT